MVNDKLWCGEGTRPEGSHTADVNLFPGNPFAHFFRDWVFVIVEVVYGSGRATGPNVCITSRRREAWCCAGWFSTGRKLILVRPSVAIVWSVTETRNFWCIGKSVEWFLNFNSIYGGFGKEINKSVIDFTMCVPATYVENICICCSMVYLCH